MKTMRFEAMGAFVGSRRIRRAVFAPQTSFSIPAACLVASAVRDALSRMLDTDVELRLFEPCVPDRRGWSIIGDGALVVVVHGAKNDAAIVLRPAEAASLACAAFGESTSPLRSLSALETRTLERIIDGLLPSLASACGPVVSVGRGPLDLATFAVYLEFRIERPCVATIGIALSREPVADVSETLMAEALDDVDVTICARTMGLAVPAHELAMLRVGDVVPITTEPGVMTAELSLAGSAFARGECGVRGNRLALAIGLSSSIHGGSEPES